MLFWLHQENLAQGVQFPVKCHCLALPRSWKMSSVRNPSLNCNLARAWVQCYTVACSLFCRQKLFQICQTFSPATWRHVHVQARGSAYLLLCYSKFAKDSEFRICLCVFVTKVVQTLAQSLEADSQADGAPFAILLHGQELGLLHHA